MNKLVTDTPEDNIQAALNLFYIKDGWTWVRGGGQAPGYPDVSLCDYVRDIIKEHIPDTEIPDNDDDLSMMMDEWLFDGPITTEGVVAMLCTAGWAFAELRHRLKAYEDTGVVPETIACFDIVGDHYGVCTERLAELAQADKEGRLVVLSSLPDAKPGYSESALYWISDGEIIEDYVADVTIGRDSTGKVSAVYYTHDGETFMQDDIGKIAFLSLKEAKEALTKEEQDVSEAGKETARDQEPQQG